MSKRPVAESFDVRWGVVCLKSWCHETLVCVCELQRFLFLGHTPLCILEAPVHNHSPLPSCVSVPLCVTAPHLRVAWHPRVPVTAMTLTHPVGFVPRAVNEGPRLGPRGASVAAGRMVGMEL